jgi:hypothetical protein
MMIAVIRYRCNSSLNQGRINPFRSNKNSNSQIIGKGIN